MMMRVSVTSLILILSIFCSPSWAQRPANLSCPQGLVECEGESPRQQCVPPHWFCDGYDDCGNNWDEDPAACAAVTCELPGYYQCPKGAGGRPCVPERWLCDGSNECADNSDEDPQVCQANAHFALQQCFTAISQQCLMQNDYYGMSDLELYQMLVNTDVQELCRPVLIAQECVTEVLASQVCEVPDLDHASVITMQQHVEALNITVNHICRENVEVLEQHKECLLRGSEFGPVLLMSLAVQCPQEGVQLPCIATEFLDCAEGVVSQQCGQEIAGLLRTIATDAMRAFGCETRKRFQMKKEMRMHSVFTGKKLMKKKTYSPLQLMRKAFPTLF